MSERVALAEAIAERLQGRAGNPEFRANGGNISTIEETGKTRDIAAAKAGLGSGKTLEAAQKVIARQTDPIKATVTKIIVQSHLRNLSGTVIAGCTIRAMRF